ncbi:MAG: 6-carboxytetrahydropterin synthase [Burkholderiaceae bacterium]|jgi:6-pyruvoyltetrahydropterin/6-carboxytetrahydropterin synthase
MISLSQKFFFEAAHTLVRENDSDASRRIHGHTYSAEVTVRGHADPVTGMVLDLSILRAYVAEVKLLLDHRMLNEVDGLGAPTLENLASFIAQELHQRDARVSSVKIWREASGDACTVELLPKSI